MSVSIKSFLETEINQVSKRLLMDTIKKSEAGGKTELLMLSIYGVEINAKNDTVEIYNDLSPETPPLKMTLATFLNHIKDYRQP